MSKINDSGIEMMLRNIFILQQTLTNITMSREIALDQARHYFELFYLSPEVIRLHNSDYRDFYSKICPYKSGIIEYE